MSEEKENKRFESVTAEKKDKCVAALKLENGYSLKSFLPVSEQCHFERYNFIHPLGKLGIVYDTKAQIFSLTARRELLNAAVKAFGFSADEKSALVAVTESSEKARNNAEPLKLAPARTVSQKASEKPAKTPVKKTPEKAVQSSAKKAEQTSVKKERNNGQKVAAAKKDKPATAKKEKAVKEKDGAVSVGGVAMPSEPLEYKNGYSIKKCSKSRLDGILKRIRAMKGVSVTSDSGKEIITYAISERTTKQKCLLRYTTGKQTVQLQGKRSNLFGEVQVILSSGSGFSEAVGSHMELTGEQTRASAVQRSLKKLLPDAFSLLSEQSKIDLSIGMIDISNEDVRLSDYSVLLVPPYRGLERFIFDLQQAKSISVKMIGQAYEKNDDGKHVLKQCYRRKNGIVYSEVMSALYCEYFEKRNFYAHSDNSEFGNSRIISDKAAAKNIFDRLCEIINYNGKKLKETGFSLPVPKA